jgi:hypothetical protein
MSYAFQDPSVPLTAVAAAQADALAPAFALYATHQRVANLESGASTQGLSLATAEAALEDITAGHVAFNTIAIAVNPTATDTITIGADVYEFVAAGGDVAADTNIGVVRGADVAASMANLVAAVNATYTSSLGTGLFQTDSSTPALKNGTENVVAFYAGGVLNISAADAPGGDIVAGTTPNIACSDALTEVTAWAFANLNLSTGGSFQPTKVARVSFAVTAGQISAGSVVVRVPVQSVNAVAYFSAFTAAGVEKHSHSDTITIAAVTGSTTLSDVTLTLNGGGSDIAATNVVFIEVWA